MKIASLPIIDTVCPEIRKKLQKFQNHPELIDPKSPEFKEFIETYTKACPGSMNFESILRSRKTTKKERRAEENLRMRYATDGERFIAEHHFAPVIATHTDQVRYFKEHTNNERWCGIHNGALKVAMMHSGALAQGKKAYTVVGIDVPLVWPTATIYVGIQKALENGWDVLLASLPQWRGDADLEQLILDALAAIEEGGISRDNIKGLLYHPEDTY